MKSWNQNCALGQIEEVQYSLKAASPKDYFSCVVRSLKKTKEWGPSRATYIPRPNYETMFKVALLEQCAEKVLRPPSNLLIVLDTKSVSFAAISLIFLQTI